MQPVPTNLVCSYAWLELAAQSDPSFKADLDRLVVRLEADDVLLAQKIAGQYLAGHWPGPLARPVDQGDSRLAVQGMSKNGHVSLVILNGGTFTVGEMIDVQSVKSPKTEKLAVSCFEIGADYVLVEVAGEPSLKMLPVEER